MGSKYPVLTPKEMIKTLEKFGFRYVSQKGSHMKYAKGNQIVIIPNHSEIAKGTLKVFYQWQILTLIFFLSNYKKSPPCANTTGIDIVYMKHQQSKYIVSYTRQKIKYFFKFERTCYFYGKI